MYATQIPAHLVPDSSATQFNLTVDGLQLEIYCCEPNKQAISQYRQGTAKFAVYENQGVAYFLSKFGDNGWMEAPFHAGMNPPQLAGVPTEYVEGRHHFALAVRLLDSSSDATYGARLVTLSEEMSARLVAIARTQLAAPITRQDYETRIQRTFSHYTASQMARMALVRCRGGENEPAANEPSMSAAKGAGETEQGVFVQEFTHITLLTGREHIERAETVEPQAREFICRLIEDSRPNGWTELALQGKKYPVHMTIEDSNLTCRLCLPCFIGERKPITVVLIAVALDAAKGQDCWRAIHAAAGLEAVTDVSRPPKGPWIAVQPMFTDLGERYLKGENAASHFEMVEMMMWAGGFQRWLAFGFARWVASR